MVNLKSYSLSTLVERFGQSFKRFPIAMLLTLFLACFLIYDNHGGKVSVKMEFFLMFYPSTAALLAVALSLLTEGFKSKFVAIAVQAVVHAAWFAVSYYLAQFEHFSLPQLIAVSATVATIGLAVFLICFYRKNHDLPFWNFSIRTILALFVAYAISGIMYLGLVLLVESLKMLFGIHINDTIYPDMAIVCLVLLAPALFMNLLPKREQKYTYDVPEFSRFSKGVVQYLFLPLLGVYIFTLYAYGAKILLQWSLPVGGVSYLVTGSMVLMVLLIYFTYPILHMEGNKLFKCVTRWLPVLMLPLLALMTVAIYRRLSDYGITVSRLYLLVFNLWCYAVCLWLICTRNKRIWLIPASFAVILFLISVGPQSIPNVTQRQLLKEARMAFTASGLKQFPISGEQYKQWLLNTDPKIAKAIDSKLDYLRTYYDFGTISGLVGKDAVVGNLTTHDEVVAVEGHNTYYNDEMAKSVTIPQGYTTLSVIGFHCDGSLGNDGKLEIRVVPTTGSVVAAEGDDPVASPAGEAEYKFEVNAQQLIERDQDRNPGGGIEPLMIDNGKVMLVVNRFSLTINDDTYDLFGDGILLTK